jgi:hypothetical protein
MTTYRYGHVVDTTGVITVETACFVNDVPESDEEDGMD